MASVRIKVFFSDLKMLRNRVNSSVVSEKNKMENMVWGN